MKSENGDPQIADSHKFDLRSLVSQIALAETKILKGSDVSIQKKLTHRALVHKMFTQKLFTHELLNHTITFKTLAHGPLIQKLLLKTNCDAQKPDSPHFDS